MAMIEKTFVDANLEIKLTSYIDSKQNIWFKGKEIAQILGYVDTDDATRRHASEKYKKTYPGVSPGQIRYHLFVSEPGFYELVFKSKLPIAEKFQDWVFSKELPSIRKYGQYNIFDNPNNQMFKIKKGPTCIIK